MKKILLAMIAFCTLYACSPKNEPEPGVPPTPEVMPTSFPRKHLLEHFTGETCGYCPAAMFVMDEFMAQTSKNFIWVSHHYGYEADEYSIPANTTIGTKLQVSSAPNASINRTKRRVSGTNAYTFHPGYLEDNSVPLNDADTALANVIISRSYNPTTRELSLNVHGLSLLTDTILNLSVLIKESGLIGAQADYSSSWEGWSEFRHNKVVRVMLTDAMGDKVSVVDGKYSKTFTYTLPAEYKAENCVVVAYITANSALTVNPIINAEQIPVVEGTTGGEELRFEGIKMVEVGQNYPEEGAPHSEITFSTCNVDTKYFASNGILVLIMRSTQTKRVSGYSCTPYLQLYVYSQASTLAAGTYPLTDTPAWNTVMAGQRDDENFRMIGSTLYYVYNYNNSLYVMGTWLPRTGELKVYENGAMEITATTLNGSTFHGTYGEIAAPQVPLRAAAPMPLVLRR